MQINRDNDIWLADLRAEGAKKDAALDDLHKILLRVLPSALSRWLPTTSSHFDTFVEDVAQETILRVIDRLDTFQGRSKFTTWVYKIGVNIGLGQLRLKKWKEVSLDGLEEGDQPDEMPSERFASDKPSQEELTPHQHKVMMAVAVQGVPLNVVAEKIGSNRNALYKLIHDARLRLKRRLEREGLSPADLLAVFSE
jgi:RNA polymerase sigma-70 factor (ECF subfamily)